MTSRAEPSGRAGITRVALANVAIATALLVVLGVAEWRGRSARRAAPVPTLVELPSLAGALWAWRASDVRGRVLVHFARRIALDAEPGPVTDANYLRRAIDEGRIRRILHVIPDDAWGEVTRALEGTPDVRREGGIFLLRTAGFPVDVLRREDLPPLREPVLVTVEADRWSPAARAWIADRLRGGALRADVTVWTGAPPPDLASTTKR